MNLGYNIALCEQKYDQSQWGLFYLTMDWHGLAGRATERAYLNGWLSMICLDISKTIAMKYILRDVSFIIYLCAFSSYHCCMDVHLSMSYLQCLLDESLQVNGTVFLKRSLDENLKTFPTSKHENHQLYSKSSLEMLNKVNGITAFVIN